jgi:nitrate/nitrite transport system substrate-binding protein
MKRWGYVKKDIDYAAIAKEVYLATDAQAVMAEMGQKSPAETFREHVIMGKTFNPGRPQQYVDSFAIKRS